jgi:uncharacterized protein (TIGR03382 family)
MKTLYAAAAAMLITGAAHADLTGTDLSISLNHAGPFDPLTAITNQTWTYGTPGMVDVPNWGMLHIVSPVVVPMYDNALSLDFTMFAYATFTGMFATNATLKLEGIDEAVNLSSVRVFVNGVNIGSGVASATDGFQVNWSTTTVFNGNPVTPGVTVAWNSTPVPAPGALALLGLAGAIGSRRRRRA